MRKQSIESHLMWSYLPTAIVVIVVSGWLPAGAADLLPVPNATFSDGPDGAENMPKGWHCSVQGDGKGRWETEGHSGNCISLENFGHDDQVIIGSDKFAIEPFQNYRLTFWHRARTPIARMAEVWINFGERNPNAGCRNFTVSATRDWQQQVIEFTTPNIQETFLWFILFAHSENSKLYVDDVRLEKLGPAKVGPQSIKWETEATSTMKSAAGIFTMVNGPRTSRPLTTVLPLTSLYVVNTAPPSATVVDGIVGDLEYFPWASTIGPLRALSDGGPTEDRTYAYVTCDDKRLYIAWKATYRGNAPSTVTKPEERDGHVNVDDCVEVLFTPPGGSSFHFIGNAAGAFYDDRDGDFHWNGNWEYKASIRPGVWHGEVAIAWTDLGLAGPPADGSEWAFDVCRASNSYPEMCKWCWLNGVTSFVNKQFMGRVRFDSKGFGFSLAPLTARLGENMGLLYIPTSRDRTGSLVFGMVLWDENGAEVTRSADVLTPRPGDQYVHGFAYTLPQQAVYTLSLSVQDPLKGTELFQLTVPLKARPDLEVNARVYPFQKRIIVAADSSRTGATDAPGNKLRLTILSNDKAISTIEIPRTAASQFNGEFPIKDFPAGTYELAASVITGESKELASSKQSLVIPPIPAWYGNSLGKTDAVLPPFKPVVVEGAKVSVWNRSYEFGAQGFPAQMTSAGETLLAEPVSAQLLSQGKPVSLATGSKVRLVSSTQRCAVLESAATEGPIRLSVRTATEYDGMMKLDFTLDPGTAPLDADGFVIRFPFKQARAIYADAPVAAPPFHHVIGKDGWRLERSFTEGSGEVYGRFWLGDDDRGVDFSFLGDQGWRPYDRPNAVQIERRGDRVNVDFHILGKVRLDKPVSGTLLVTATPLRPFPNDVRHRNTIILDQRVMKIIPGQDQYASESLQTYAALGVNVLLASDYWSNGYGRPEPFDPPNFRKLVSTAKSLGMKVVIYIGVGCWAETCPESPYMAEWEQIPGFRCSSGRPDQAFMAVSLTRANGGHDCLVSMIDRMVSEYDVDGVYVDGSGWGPNANMDIGFGYKDETGKVRPTSTILEIRELFKRINAVFVAHGKTPFIEHHCSWMLAAPVDAFSSSHLTGEYLAYRANEETDFPENWSRIENTGAQLGLPVEVLCYNTGIWQRYIANTFIYGATPATTLSSLPAGGNQAVVRAISPHLLAFKAFDVAGADWIPYWKLGALVRAENPAHKASLYRHPKQGMLVLLANTSREKGQAKVAFDMKALGLAGDAAAKVVNKENAQFEFTGGTLTITLEADDFIMLRIGG